jgi:hypothetical protein
MINNELMVNLGDINKLSDAPAYESNPYAQDLCKTINVKSKKIGSEKKFGSIEMVNKNTGEVESIDQTKTFYRKQKVDNDTFLKLYPKYLKLFFNLSSPAIKVLLYIFSELQKPDYKDSNLLYFYIQDCMEIAGYNSRSAVYNGLIELIRVNFIQRHKVANVYYVNPEVVFNGNRILIVEEIERDFNPDKKKINKAKNSHNKKLADKKIKELSAQKSDQAIGGILDDDTSTQW